jgi:mRNA interferase MazF
VSAETHEPLRKLAATTGAPLRRALERAADPINQGPADLVVALPFTTRRRGCRDPCRGPPPDGGLREVSFTMCEQVRSLAADRLGPRPFGSVPAAAMRSVEESLRLLLRL